MKTKKTNLELGFIIPVQKKVIDGRYQVAFVKEFVPDNHGNIRVRTHKLITTTWKFDKLSIIQNYTPVENPLIRIF